MTHEEFLSRLLDAFYQQIVLSFLKGFGLGVSITLLAIKLGG